ncbi:MAG: hypothetical protein ACTHN2_07615, partial [Nitrobacter sp.]
EGKITFASILTGNELVLALDLLVPYAHWITPEGMPKRFDTWFFLAAAPPEQVGAHDGRESTDSIWVTPRDALAGNDTGRFKLPFPTTRNLIKLSKQPAVAAALDEARGKPVVTVMPIMRKLDGNKRELRIPSEAGHEGDVFEWGGFGRRRLALPFSFVMAGFIPAIHALQRCDRKDVDGRDEPGHDAWVT